MFDLARPAGRGLTVAVVELCPEPLLYAGVAATKLSSTGVSVRVGIARHRRLTAHQGANSTAQDANPAVLIVNGPESATSQAIGHSTKPCHPVGPLGERRVRGETGQVGSTDA